MIYALLYICFIVLVNIGFAHIPLVALPWGEVWPPMSLAVGFVFVLRDFAQRAIGHWVWGAMLLSAVLSYFMASPAIAIASSAAFLISEAIDWLVYTASKRPMRQRILLSSAIATPVDSVAFLAFIGHFSVTGAILMTLSKMVGAGAVWAMLRKKPMVWDEWRGNGKPAMWLKRLAFIAGCRLDLHKFVAADDADCFHTHPSYCIRIVFRGGYVEEMPDGSKRTWRPGMIGLVKPRFAHRIHALRTERPSYSLWFRGPIVAKVQLIGSGWPKDAQTMSTEK